MLSADKEVEIMNDSISTSDTKKSLDISSMRLDQNFVNSVDGEKVTTTIPVRKPNKQEFIRTHSNAEYWFGIGIIEDEELGDIYAVNNVMQQALISEWRAVILVPTMSRQGTLFLWPIKIPGEDGRTNTWNTSSMQAAILAKDKWARVMSNMSLKAYETYVSSTPLPEPVWPDLTIEDMIDVAFEGKIITSVEHPFVQKLQGVA